MDFNETKKRPKDLENYFLKYNNDVCISFSYVKMENPAEEEFAPRILSSQIYVQDDDSGSIKEIRIEIWDKHEPDFIYVSNFVESDYPDFQNKYNLEGDFDTFVNTLMMLFTKSLTTSDEHRICFYKYSKNDIRLSFFKTYIVKYVELFTIQFTEPTEEYKKEFMQCHYNRMVETYNRKDSLLKKKYDKLHILNPRLEEKVREEIKNKL